MCYQYCAEVATQANSGILFHLDVWVPAIISIIILIFNIIFSVFIAPRVNSKYHQKDKMYIICSEFMEYLSEIVSYESFAGVPTTVRKYCLKIHLMFKAGTAPTSLENQMELIFKMVQDRKSMIGESDILHWSELFRIEVRGLRKLLSEHVGIF